MNKVVKITIVGPREYAIKEMEPSVISEKITSIFKSLEEDGHTILGLTGLGSGADKLFADICIESKIDFVGYLSYDDQLAEPGIDYYLEKSLSYKVLADGKYAPKKVLYKNQQLVNDADIILFISHPLKPLSSGQVTVSGDKQVIHLCSN